MTDEFYEEALEEETLIAPPKVIGDIEFEITKPFVCNPDDLDCESCT